MAELTGRIQRILEAWNATGCKSHPSQDYGDLAGAIRKAACSLILQFAIATTGTIALKSSIEVGVGNYQTGRLRHMSVGSNLTVKVTILLHLDFSGVAFPDDMSRHSVRIPSVLKQCQIFSVYLGQQTGRRLFCCIACAGTFETYGTL